MKSRPRKTAKGAARFKWKSWLVSCKAGDSIVLKGHQRTNAYQRAQELGVMVRTEGLPNNRARLTILKTL